MRKRNFEAPPIEGDENGNQLIGTPQNDIINGNDGGDQLIGNGGNDIRTGGAGEDNIIGGEGTETARFDDAHNAVTILEDPDQPGRIIAARLAINEDGVAIIEEDEISGIEQVVFPESGGSILVDGIVEVSADETENEINEPEDADVLDKAANPQEIQDLTINGDENDNVLVGGAGDDTINGLGGNDTLTGGLGNDELNGGEGTDTAIFNDIDVPVAVTLSDGFVRQAIRETGFSVEVNDQPLASLTTEQTPEELVAEAVAGNLYYNIHTTDFPGGEIRGQLLVQSDETAEGVRTITLSAALDADQEPNDASDSEATGVGTVVIRVEDDVVTYSSDLSVEGIVSTELLPVAGVSAIHLHNAPAGINGPVITDIVQDAGGDVNGDVESGGVVFFQVIDTDELESIENVEGSNDDDLILGNDGDNVLNGNDGDDTIRGQAGNDVLNGGADNDTLIGGLGNDQLDGGEGIDTVDFRDIDVGVNVALIEGVEIAQRVAGFSVDVVDQPLESLTTEQSSVDLVAEAEAGNLYYNIHTNDFPGGEIRGQLLVASDVTEGGIRTITLNAQLDAAQEPNGASDSVATGEGTVVIVVDGETVTYSSELSVTGITPEELLPVAGVSAIHLHNAPAGINGPVITDIVQDAGGDINGVEPGGLGNVFDSVLEVDTLNNIENIEGSDDADILLGNDEANVINGNDGNDDLTGLGGNDTLNGGEGNDNLSGGGGVDIIDGGEGIDTNSFADINLGAADPSIAGVTVVVNADGSGTASYNGGGGNGPLIEEEFTGIENITGSNNNDDIRALGAAPNEINGLDGDDFIAGGGGVDVLDGGEGNDTNSFINIGAEVIADLGTGSASYAPNENVTVFENFQGFENLDGSDNDDQLFGDGGANTLTGNDGDDLLVGRGGDDVLEGGEGNDVLQGGGGNDITDGGEGIDTADFQDIGSAVTANLADGTATYAAPNGNEVADTLISIENLTGSENDDNLTGDEGDNLLAGGAGNDTIEGGAGNDVIRGDAIGDGEAITVTVTNTLGEGGTFLTPVWFGFHDGENFDLWTDGEAASGGLERIAEDGSIEGIAAEFNQEVGDGGVDATIIGGIGAPGPIDPGESASFTINVNADDVGRGYFTWATMVIPSNDAFLASPDDPLTDALFDEDGNFTGPLVIERFGSDVLDAGTEVNTEEGAAFLNQTARDQGTAENGVVRQHEGFNGSEGNPDGTPVNVLGGTTAAGTIVDPIEGDFTRNEGGEQLLRIVVDIAEGGDDILSGGAGEDFIDGGRGNDVLDGGADNDRLEGGSGRDTFLFRRGTGSDIVADFAAGVEGGELLDISDFGITGIDQLELEEDGPNTVIDLGDGDLITLEGVAPNELVAENFVFAEGEPQPEPEVVIEVTNGNDDVVGGDAAEEIEAGNGSDIVEAGGGNDVVEGGNGDDDLFGEAGNDRLFGGNGDDNLDGGIGSDELDGGNGDDVLIGGNGGDFLDGGRGDDIINGGLGNDTLEGGRGDDELNGGAGEDFICGGLGDDIINGGLGNDTLEGNRGADTFVFQANAGDDVITDFEAFGVDQLDLSAAEFGFDSFADVAGAISQQGNDVVIDLGADGSITLLGIQAADLTDENVLF